MSDQNILILAPHTDDGELGCGAVISKLIEQGKSVYYVAFSICEESVPDGFPKDILATEVRKATARLGINPANLFIKRYPVRKFPEFRQELLEEMVLLNNELKPDLVFLPSSYDIHQDHETIHKEGIRAFKNTCLLGYEFMWNNFSFSSTCFYKVSELNIEKKILSLDEYKSQIRRFYAKDKLVKGLATFRGLQISAEYAEAFEVIRWIIK